MISANLKNSGLVALMTGLVVSGVCAEELISPNRKIRAVLDAKDDAQPRFAVQYADGRKRIDVLQPSLPGLKTGSQEFSRLMLVRGCITTHYAFVM